MSVPKKSSDEILEELFGMCTKGQIFKLQDSSSNGSSEEDASDSDSTKKHKRKKKKKKRKKHKKRKKSESFNDDVQEIEKSKRKKSCKKIDYPDIEKKYSESTAFKIKSERESEITNSESKQMNCDSVRNENRCTNYMDSVTGKRLTIDDVFSSLGIINNNFNNIRIKKEEEKFINRKTEEGMVANGTFSEMKNAATLSNYEDKQSVNDTNDISNVFTVSEIKSSEIIDKNKSKKISIKNLKNSTVYEATIKEVEERERIRAEKYEEGEISSSSITSDENLPDENLLGIENEVKTNRREKKSRFHKHRQKSKSPSQEKKHRSRSHHQKRISKTSHVQGYNVEKHSSTDRNYVRAESGSPRDRDYRSHYNHRHHDYRSPYNDRHRCRHYGARSSSGSSRSDSTSHRSHSSRYRTRTHSSEKRSESRGKKTSLERRSKSKSVEKIDKQKLLEIARKNAISMLKQGALPVSVISSKDKIASIKAGGKTVDELTDFCKHLSKKDAEGHDSMDSGSDVDSETGKEGPFRHPFQIKERPAGIVMNIRNAVSLPTKTAQEKTLELSKQLSLQYPVSSGQQHRKNESEWVPVVKTQESALVSQTSTPVYASETIANAIVYPAQSIVSTICNPVALNSVPQMISIIPSTIMSPQQNVDVGSIVAQRLEAIRRLTENPRDPIANNLIQAADSKIQFWAESKIQPGLFTGSTGVKPLSAAELSAGCKAWPKKDQFMAAKPVSSDKGEALMKKMGWQPGEGLGKYKQGPSVPCEISLKTDRKGLAEQPQTRSFRQATLQKAFEVNQNKHPVSLLNEFCSRKKIGIPQYECEEKEGAARRKLYLFTVTVQGMKYMPKMPSMNKKQSKIEAATICLQALGLLPVVPTSIS